MALELNKPDMVSRLLFIGFFVIRILLCGLLFKINLFLECGAQVLRVEKVLSHYSLLSSKFLCHLRSCATLMGLIFYLQDFVNSLHKAAQFVLPSTQKALYQHLLKIFSSLEERNKVQIRHALHDCIYKLLINLN